MENLEEKFRHINGWGIDADPENEPTYPMKKYTGADHQRLNYERPVQQSSSVEVLHSNERPTLSAVYGTPNPPSGLSGILRRNAFKFSEGNWMHWLTLLLADRVNVAEGYIDDIAKGTVPNLLKEHGMASEWKYNKKAVITKVAIGVAVTGLLVAALSRDKKKAF
jgi:hypothetical protein